MIKAKDLYFSYDKDKSFITKLNVEIEKGKIAFKYFDLENTKVTNFLPIMFDKTQYKQDQFSIENIEEQIKMHKGIG